MINPFHRIEWWASTHFQPADLHEVRVFILIGHHDRVACSTLEMQQHMRDNIQIGVDERERELTNYGLRDDDAKVCLKADNNNNNSLDKDDDGDVLDCKFDANMDRLYNDDRSKDDALAGLALAKEAQNVQLQLDMVQLVHTNGVHRLLVIICGC